MGDGKGYDLDKLDRALLAMRDEIAPNDLNVAYIVILRLLLRREKVVSKITQKDICQATGINQGSISKILRTIGSYKRADGAAAGLGLVHSERDDIKRSMTNISLTDKGREMITAFEQACKPDWYDMIKHDFRVEPVKDGGFILSQYKKREPEPA